MKTAFSILMFAIALITPTEAQPEYFSRRMVEALVNRDIPFVSPDDYTLAEARFTYVAVFALKFDESCPILPFHISLKLKIARRTMLESGPNQNAMQIIADGARDDAIQFSATYNCSDHEALAARRTLKYLLIKEDRDKRPPDPL